jgi:hypothetical protein
VDPERSEEYCSILQRLDHTIYKINRSRPDYPFDKELPDIKRYITTVNSKVEEFRRSFLEPYFIGKQNCRSFTDAITEPHNSHLLLMKLIL